MSEKPILFSTEMVRAILDGRKTMTRRIAKDSMVQSIPWDEINYSMNTTPHKHNNGKFYIELQQEVDNTRHYEIKPPYQPSDILWVRETWWEYGGGYHYAADYSLCGKQLSNGVKLRPSIHMPRTAARLFIRVKNIRVERVQDIIWEDARREGLDVAEFDLTARDAFAELWNTTIKKQSLDCYRWDSNPWVWVIEFERT